MPSPDQAWAPGPEYQNTQNTLARLEGILSHTSLPRNFVCLEVWRPSSCRLLRPSQSQAGATDVKQPSSALPASGSENLMRGTEVSRVHLRLGLKMFPDHLRDKMLEGMRDARASQCNLKARQTRKCCPTVYKLMDGRE